MNGSRRPYIAFLAICLICPVVTAGLCASAAEENPCREDIAKFCGDVTPGKGAIISCLERHEDELSDACREYEARLHGRRGERREDRMRLARIQGACKDEVLRVCSGVRPASVPLVECLESHRDELSEECLKGLDRLKKPGGKTQ